MIPANGVIKLANPEDAAKFSIGEVQTYRWTPRWYVRLWNWLRGRRASTGVLQVVAVDQRRGTITVRSTPCP